MEKLKFVGRDKELKQLKDFLEDDGKSVFLVSGRAGIGKTRLLEELADWLILDTGCDYVYPFKIQPEENSEQFLFRATKSLEKHDSRFTGAKEKLDKALRKLPEVGGLIDALLGDDRKDLADILNVDGVTNRLGEHSPPDWEGKARKPYWDITIRELLEEGKLNTYVYNSMVNQLGLGNFY